MKWSKSSTWKLLAFVVVLFFGYCTYWTFWGAYRPRTARDARAADVEFLNLPASASRIGYWQDGINSLAAFDIPEADFRALFSNSQLREITEGITLRPPAFGDPNVYPRGPQAKTVTVSSGLHYAERWSNGGGYVITYDRSQSRGFYEFRRR